jgi:hypothetical protein
MEDIKTLAAKLVLEKLITGAVHEVVYQASRWSVVFMNSLSIMYQDPGLRGPGMNM